MIEECKEGMLSGDMMLAPKHKPPKGIAYWIEKLIGRGFWSLNENAFSTTNLMQNIKEQQALSGRCECKANCRFIVL